MHVLTEDDFEYEEDTNVYCPFCLERGYKIHFGGKILMPNEPRPEDYESWLECATCGFLCPIYQAEPEAEIKDAVETSESPFEAGKFQLETIPKRNSPGGKKAYAKRRRNKIKLDDDPEINELMRVYGDRVNLVYDSNP